MSATTDQRTSITTGIDVAIPPPSAFDVFTTGFDQWWNRNHHLLPGELAAVGIDPFAGGRVWERSVDGEECTWGEVLTWDPPRTFAFAWRITKDFVLDEAGAASSVVTVSFTPSDAGTRVVLVHSNLDAHGAGWQQLRDSVSGAGGWPDLLRRYADVTA